jgi:hypothetical protein
VTAHATETSGPPLEQAHQARTIQLALSAAVARDVAKVWPNLDRKRLDATFPGWLQLMIALVERYHGMSSLAASVFYQDARQAHLGIPTPESIIHSAPMPSLDWMRQAFGYSGPHLLKDGAWQDSSALSTTQGTAVRIVQSGARDTIIGTTKADPKAAGWYRVTDGDPCAFCALMASRGVVYRSEKTASFKSHNDCGCTAAPAFSSGQALPDISSEALRVYQDSTAGLPNPQRIAAFRKAWNARSAARSDLAA